VELEISQTMRADLNYYQRDPQPSLAGASARFPKNHVRFSKLLKPIEWIDKAYGLFGKQAFGCEKIILNEFDRIAPLDEYMGSREELNHVRNLVVLFCRSIDNNPYVSPVGRMILRKGALDQLKNRNKVLAFYHANRIHIEANGKIKAPVIITGLPRSGTTLLHRLLSEDPNTRSPYTFEMEVPIPPMPLEADPLADPRIKSSNSLLSRLSRIAPGFLEKLSESHHLSATEKEESLIYMLAQNCIHVMNCSTAGKAYVQALSAIENKRPIFRYEHLFFKMIDAYRPATSHWTLKTPLYAPYFPLIFEEYPDARVILTHRNPLVAFPSLCRLMESWCITFDRDGCFDKHRFAQVLHSLALPTIMVPFQYRKDNTEKESHIVDCLYAELFSNPIAMVKKIYETFSLDYTEEFEQRMKGYLQSNQQGKYGRHRYSLEEYGLDAESLYHEFKAYMDHYGYAIPDKMVRPAAMGTGQALG
jgi:hypothetical protein